MQASRNRRAAGAERRPPFSPPSCLQHRAAGAAQPAAQKTAAAVAYIAAHADREEMMRVLMRRCASLGDHLFLGTGRARTR